MKFKLKKRLGIFLLILVVGLCTFTLMDTGVVEADSGWDSSYGGGSSSWGSSSSSSWGSSDYSSWDSSGSSSSHTYSGSSSDLDSNFWMAFVGFTVIIVTAMLIPFLVDTRKKGKKVFKSDGDDEESIRLLVKEGINIEKLKDELYDKFVKVQEGWMNFDYNLLSSLCGDELYNQYKTDLETLRLTNGQNIMSDFRKKSIYIRNTEITETTVKVIVDLKVTFKDYVINTETKKLIKGSNKTFMNNEYYLVFVKVINNTKKCPSCGAPLNNQAKCEYCGCVVPNNNDDFVLVDKKILR